MHTQQWAYEAGWNEDVGRVYGAHRDDCQARTPLPEVPTRRIHLNMARTGQHHRTHGVRTGAAQGVNVDGKHVIRSYRGSDKERRGLCYDQHQVWVVTGTVTLPGKLPCVLRGKWDR